MVIVFYNAKKNELYICSERDPMKTVSLEDKDLLSQVPSDDILYVQKGCYITKHQLSQWLDGDMNLNDAEKNSPGAVNDNLDKEPDSSENPERLYIHPAHNGTIIIADIHTDKFPNGVTITGKWNFMPIDYIGADILEESRHFKTLKDKGKIKVVTYEYVKKHRHKNKQYISPTERALNRILIKDSTSGTAEKVADSGGQEDGDIAETIYVN